ncbi:GPW/gp25 family protein [Spirosoma sp. KCTC 42546]|uniref:GPW/gp25 family protein n=1 Tax=Spirosoma sp. KCTC 42546 TaxID=2520506 RepID=UPI001158E678|nr:GPW/gp25 family protein [Spirosoma sp. KCTC 42546]QDK82120.1 GPW/gp25 family protein [Spirosoma sp. KCTC 42546]
MIAENNFLGRGWSFPPTFNQVAAPAGIEMTAGLADIERSLHILLTTQPGERLMIPDFGCDMQDSMFEPISTALQTRVKDRVETAILLYEPRIDPIDVTVEESPEQQGLLLITVNYVVRSTNTRYNFVYPFYTNEGTEIRNPTDALSQ